MGHEAVPGIARSESQARAASVDLRAAGLEAIDVVAFGFTVAATDGSSLCACFPG